MKVLSEIMENKIIAIIRGVKPEHVLSIAKSLYQGGIKVLEITLNSPNALQAIEEIAGDMGDKLLVGAGTVLDRESAVSAIRAGAKFIISPSVDIETIKVTKQYGAVSIPGAFTPTEILKAYQNGGDIIKVFPVTTLGPRYVKDIHGPLPQIPLLPTGGINLSNIGEYIKAGSVGVGLGSSLVNSKEEVNEEYLLNLTEKAEQFVQVIKSIGGKRR